MLQYLDTLIAFAVIMLGISLLITILTQLVSAVLRLRGRNLVAGLKLLLEHADDGLKQHAKTIAESVLKHSLISDSLLKSRLATTIRKEEMKRVVNLLANPNAPAGTWSRELHDKLTAAQDQVESWFDSVMDRTSQRFVAKTRLVTAILAIVAAFLLHLDAPKTLRYLQSNAEIRAGLVASSESMLRIAEKAEAAETETEIKAELDRLRGQAESIETQLAETGLDLTPDYRKGKHFFFADLSLLSPHFWGILASGALLSLGAPFWFNALKNLSSLRPVLARKEEAERAQRKP